MNYIKIQLSEWKKKLTQLRLSIKGGMQNHTIIAVKDIKLIPLNVQPIMSYRKPVMIKVSKLKNHQAI
jgi:hypothetical protein